MYVLRTKKGVMRVDAAEEYASLRLKVNSILAKKAPKLDKSDDRIQVTSTIRVAREKKKKTRTNVDDCLQGQMLYIPESDLVIFLCYPSVMNLDDLTR